MSRRDGRGPDAGYARHAAQIARVPRVSHHEPDPYGVVRHVRIGIEGKVHREQRDRPLAALVPAVRAARVHPVTAQRAE